MLDLGCVKRSWKSALADDWIHADIRRYAKEVTGLDIKMRDVEKLNEMGYSVVCADAQCFDLNTKFDVIFAGELIEHLDNVNDFLKSCRKHMRDDSLLVLTTPNCFGLRPSFWRLVGRPIVLRDHRCWYDADTLANVLEDNGFSVESVNYVLKERIELTAKSAPQKFLVVNFVLEKLERTFSPLAPTLLAVAKLQNNSSPQAMERWRMVRRSW